jgi:hypothetical protein
MREHAADNSVYIELHSSVVDEADAEGYTR